MVGKHYAGRRNPLVRGLALISRWRFSVIDNNNLDGSPRGFEPQSKLLLESLCDGGARYA